MNEHFDTTIPFLGTCAKETLIQVHRAVCTRVGRAKCALENYFFFHNKPLAWNLMTLLIEKTFFSDLNTRMSPECYIKI